MPRQSPPLHEPGEGQTRNKLTGHHVGIPAKVVKTRPKGGTKIARRRLRQGSKCEVEQSIHGGAAHGSSRRVHGGRRVWTRATFPAHPPETGTRSRVRSGSDYACYSSKRVHCGEPMKIGVSNLRFISYPNSIPKLVVSRARESGKRSRSEITGISSRPLDAVP